MTNKHNTLRNSEHTAAEKAKGDNLMKNTIKTNRSAELEAKKAAEAAAARQAELDAIQPKDIVGTMDDIEQKLAHTYRDEQGNARNVTGGTYLQIPGKNGGTIAAKTQEELDAIKERNPEAMLCTFIANHDTDRAAGFLTVDIGHAHMGANLSILTPGSPFIYYGEEIGMPGSGKSLVSEKAVEKGAIIVSMGDIIREEAKKRGESTKETAKNLRAAQSFCSGGFLYYFSVLFWLFA